MYSQKKCGSRLNCGSKSCLYNPCVVIQNASHSSFLTSPGGWTKDMKWEIHGIFPLICEQRATTSTEQNGWSRAGGRHPSLLFGDLLLKLMPISHQECGAWSKSWGRKVLLACPCACSYPAPAADVSTSRDPLCECMPLWPVLMGLTKHEW